MTDPRASMPEQPIVVHGPVHGSAETTSDAGQRDAHGPPPPSSRARVADGTALPEVAPPLGWRHVASSNETIAEPRRAHSLDALRGLFLMLMTLGFTIHDETFPVWMYHRQMPPPSYAVVEIAGISWRDLAYAAFLFTMAAALPLTLSRRIEKGETEVAIVLATLRRYFMLFVFALLVAHSNTALIGYGNRTRALAIVGFIIMAMIYTRRRMDWDRGEYKLVNGIGWIAAIVFLALSPLVYDSTFSFARNDDIIRGLAFASLTGSVVWYFTRDRLEIRLVILAGVLALYLGARGEGWLGVWWWSSPFKWLMEPADLSLLSVVIPGTIAGDLLLRWMRAPSTTTASFAWPRSRVIVLGLLCLLVTPVVVFGLYNRWILATTQIVLGILIAGWFLTWRANTSTERLLRQLFLWGALWLTLGLFLESAEGGIKKVPETLSYFFTVTGLTTLLLVTMSAAAARVKTPAWMRPLLDVGTNPLFCYVLFTVFLNSALEMVPALRPVLRGSLGLSLLRSVLTTALVVLIVQAFTRAKIYWRT